MTDDRSGYGDDRDDGEGVDDRDDSNGSDGDDGVDVADADETARGPTERTGTPGGAAGKRGTAEKRATAEQFGAAASAYFESAVHRDGEDVRTLAAWCADASRALDVATGGGHTAGAIVEVGVPRVVAADAAPEMVATAVSAYGVEGVVADAERLPFAADSFDAVACRIAAHHFPDPEAFVAEVARVLEPGGVFAFEDNVAPTDPALADWLNGVERLRDPTHVELLSVSEWTALFESVGLRVEETTGAKITLDFDAWVERTNVAPDDVAALHRRFRELSPAARDLFEVEFAAGSESDGGDEPRVVSWANPKAVMRVRRE